MPEKDRNNWLKRAIKAEKRLSVQGKMQLLFVLAIVLCVLISLPFVYIEAVTLKNHFHHETTKTLTRLIEVPLADQLLNIDLPAIERTVDSFKQALDVEAFCLFNKEMIVVKSLKSECHANELAFVEPVHNVDGQIEGYLYVQASNGYENGILYRQLIVAACLVVVFFIVSFLMLLRLRFIISRPLEELSSSVAKFLKSNDFHIRASHFSDDEIGRLAAAFNHLLQDMRSKEHALLKAKNKADEANELKGDFLASVSHEIRTPMNGIIGTTELLLESLEKQKHKNYASTILRSSESLLAIINDILDFSKIESGKLEIESIPFNLYAEIEDVADLMTMRANEKDIEIILAISPYIPEVVIGDPSRLRQVLNNLVNNAIKFTDNGHILIEVEPLGCSVSDDAKEKLRFSVVDTGIGISESAQKKIFERFTQAESSITRQYGGTGLGLAICKQLVELLGGEIHVESVEGKGSTFSFTLDFTIDKEQAVHENTEKLEGLHALVIDDNPYFLEYIKLALRYFGLRVSCVSSAKEAIRLVGRFDEKGEPFDVILIDENMPMVNGCALAENIGLTYVDSAPPIIILSDISADMQHEQVYSKLGISAYIQKPIRLRQLTALIELTILSGKTAGANVLTVDEIRGSSNNRSNHFKLAGPQILVAEANDTHYKFIETILLEAGCKVVRVCDGDAVIEYVMNYAVDLMVLDIELPVVNGIDVAKSFRKMQAEMAARHTPIIATAARDVAVDTVHAVNAGIDLFIHKQSLKNQLVSKISVLIPNFIINQKNDLVYFEGVKILLVEDNRVNAQITTEILNEFGCEVVLCIDGKEALDCFREARFDAVLMDCQMPIMDGFESTRHIRHFERSAHRSATPIIALTANAMKGDSERCFNAGMDDYITKPIKREKLRTLLAKCVDSSKISIKPHSGEQDIDNLIDDEEFSRVLAFSSRAGIDVERYIVDIEKSLQLLESQFRSQSARVIYETTQVVIPVCEAFGFLRLRREMLRFSQAALDLHAEKISRTDILAGLLQASIKTATQTKEYIQSLHNEIVVTLPEDSKDYPPIGEGATEAANAASALIRINKAPSNASINRKSDDKSSVKVFENKVEQSHELVDKATFDATKNVFKKKFDTILGEYIEDSEEYLACICSGLAEQDFHRIRENAHPLKSSSYTLGFCAVGDLAKNIETYAKKSTGLEEIQQDIEKLVKAFDGTKAFITSGALK